VALEEATITVLPHSQASSQVTVTITTDGFQPEVISVTTATQVRWYNDTSFTHTLKGGETHQVFLPIVLRGAGGNNVSTVGKGIPGSQTTALHVKSSASFSAILPPGGTFTHTFTLTGDYHYFLATEPQSMGRAIVQQPLTVDLSALPLSGTRPLSVTFIAHTSDLDSDRLYYTWDFGDGTAASLPVTSSLTVTTMHTYADWGTYTATVTLNDGRAVANASQVITVTGPDFEADATCLYVVNWWRNPSPPYDIIRSTYSPACLAATHVEVEHIIDSIGRQTGYRARVERQDEPGFDIYAEYDLNDSGGVIGADVTKVYHTATNTTTAASRLRYSQTWVNLLNQAPILDNSGSPTLTAVFQNDPDPDGTLVSDILASGAGGDPITDPDVGAVDGIAVTAVDQSNGVWQFSTDGGETWNDFPSFPVSLNLGQGEEKYYLDIREFCPNPGELTGYIVRYSGQDVTVGICP
jgi:PKD repeat protein